MRAFSYLEKQIVRKMIELDETPGSFNVLANILYSFSSDSHLPDYCYIHVKSEADVAIMVRTEVRKEHGGDWLSEVDGKISRLLLTTVKLFEFLEKNELAFFVGDYDISTLGETWVDTAYDRCEFLAPESKALIYRFTRKKVYVSESLKALAENKFKPLEQIRHEKELLATRITLGVTFAALIASILVPVLGTTAVKVLNSEFSVSPGRSMSELIQKNTDAVSSIGASAGEIQKSLLVIREELEKIRVELENKHNNQVNKDASR